MPGQYGVNIWNQPLTETSSQPQVWAYLLGAAQALAGQTAGSSTSLAALLQTLINKQFALNGTPTVYSDTSAHTGTWSGFQVITAAVFTSCTGLAGTSGLTFPAGMTIIAPITAFTLASGAIYPTPA